MKVQEIMSRPVVTCRTDDTLETAAWLMWTHDCGAVPVLDEQGKVAGIITDRDVCMGAALRGKALRAIAVADTMSRTLVACHPDDRLDAAETLMSDHQIRRVPVVDDEGKPVGMLALNDIARHAAVSVPRSGEQREAIRTISAIGRHRSEALQPVELMPPAAPSVCV
jgi:CBS domain-containing protein